MTSALPLPARCGIGFKEWSGVCNALESGRQAILLRKGGIAEENGHFTPEHTFFWLFPTYVHEAQQGLKADALPGEAVASPPAGEVPIQTLAAVQFTGYLQRETALAALAPQCVWTEETLRRRFHYRQPGLWVLAVRIYRRPTAWPLAVTPAQAGCKSWVDLEQELPTTDLYPALDDEPFAQALERIRSVVDLDPRCAPST